MIKKFLSVAFLSIVYLYSSSLVKFSEDIPYSGKPIMLFFDSKSCPYCKKIKEELTEDKMLHSEAVKFDIYRIPRDEQKLYTILGNKTSTQNLQMLYKIKVTPYLVLLTSKGEKIWQIPGYVRPDVLAKIMAFVEGVDKGRYKKEEWRDYLKKNGII